MQQAAQNRNRRGTLGAAAVTVILILVGVTALVLGVRGTGGPPQPVAAAPRVTATQAEAPPSATPSVRPSAVVTEKPRAPQKPRAAEGPPVRFGKFLPASAPVSLEIPSIDLSSSNFVDLEVAKDGTLEVPGDADEVGLYENGPTPGQLGPAVLGAHVDSTKGPGVFYRLGAVKPGAKIHVTRQDKSRATFVVDKVKTYPKDDFPTEEVYYGDFDRSEIRLVTCGGPFDPVKHYLDNTIVFGHLVGST
jgi:sortase (surface protein transpeptidase)